MRRKKSDLRPLENAPVFPAAGSQEQRESQLIALAYDLVEQRMRDGTASANEVCHFLRLGSSRDRLEREVKEEQKKLIGAKTGAYESSKRLEILYKDAIDAMKRYSGQRVNEYDGQDSDLQ